ETAFLTEILTQDFLNEVFPAIHLHGDLWASNILIEKHDPENSYMIDWEHAKNYLFFYDLFFLMLNEAFLNQNIYYLQRYMSGNYDAELHDFFSLFGLRFKKKYRLDYLVITIIAQYLDRWNSAEGKELEKINRKLKELLETIQKMKAE